MPQLISYIENEYPQVHDLETGKISIGRSRENDIRLKESSVSAFHAVLTKKEGSSFRLENRNSQNGTAVNGKEIEDIALKDGDEIRFGSVKAVFLDREKSRQKLEELQSETDHLLRKSEIERNNLKLLEGDSRQVRIAMEKSFGQKDELEAELDHLVKEIDKVKADLEVKREESEVLSENIEAAKVFEKRADELQTELDSRQSTCEELSRKIIAGEKLYGELDLENSIRQKEELNKDLDRISKKIDKSRTELEENKRKSKEAASIFEEAKMLEAGISDLEAKLKTRKNDCEELEKKIAEREKICKELEELTISIEDKRKELADLDITVKKNQDLIESAREKLTGIETTINNGLDEISRSQETQKSLAKESLTLTRIVSEKSVVLQRLKERINSRGTRESVCPPVRLINPGMSSLVHYFHQGAGIPDEKVDPIGYHGFAACTKGSMHRDADSIMSGDDPVLLLLSGELNRDKDLIESMTSGMPGTILLVCWREGRLKSLAAEQGVSGLTGILAGVSGIISAESDTAGLFEKLDVGCPHLNVPIPCPVEFADWDFSVPVSKRTRGIFVSGDGFDPDSKLHRTRLDLLNQLVEETETAVTLCQQEPGGIKGLNIPDQLLTTSEAPGKYSEYLRLIGQHYLVTGFGRNSAGGEISGDAVLARSVFLGANRDNATEELIFPDLSISGNDIKSTLKNAARLLSDKDAYRETMERSQGMAIQLISFESVRDRLREFIQLVSGN